MSAQQQDDGQTRFALGLVGSLVALVVAGVIGLAIHQQGRLQTVLTPQQEQEIAATSPTLVGDAADTRVTVEQGVVTFYFASGSAALASGTNPALRDIVQGVEAGRRAVISGYHDPSGDAILNAALAKERAQAVGNALQVLGVPADRIEYRKPADAAASGDAAQARRVEVTLAD